MSSSSYLPQLSCLSVDLCFKDNRYIKNTHDTKIFVWAKFCRGSVDGLPNLRAFSLRARVKDSETALELLGHMSEFRPLHDCAFYFDIREKGDILPVMRQTAHEVTSPSRYRPGVFNFFDLPKELQLMVHENLVGSRWDPFLHSSAPARGVIALLNRKSDDDANYEGNSNSLTRANSEVDIALSPFNVTTVITTQDGAVIFLE
ncbi:hypothetical protein MAP00_003127 [Monascus purpureus]|nr:hypothetical protein MAP00_003127 [Monascus purpureus]